MKETIKLPLNISITNISDKVAAFVPYRENELFTLSAGGNINFTVESAEMGFYYKKQASNNLIVGAAAASKDSAEAGSYDLSTETFTAGASYSLTLVNSESVTESSITTTTYNYAVSGVIPYSQATQAIGMPAGNRFTARLSNADIESKSDLPGGTICTVAVEGGTTINYTKAGFESDGSNVSIINVRKGSKVTITIKWSSTETAVYVFTFNNIKLGTDGQHLSNVESISVDFPATITLTNIGQKATYFVLYKENFETRIEKGDAIKFPVNSSSELFYYLLQKNADIDVSL